MATLRLVMDALVSSSSAEYDPKAAKGRPATSAWIYWKRPDEWATVLYDWVRLLWTLSAEASAHASPPQVKETGQTNSIMTFYELTEGGDLVHTTGAHSLPSTPSALDSPTHMLTEDFLSTEFYRMPIPLLRKVLDILIRQGKAQVLKGVGEEGDGVKFV